jgi:ABC-type transport system substrate-binding protein
MSVVRVAGLASVLAAMLAGCAAPGAAPRTGDARQQSPASAKTLIVATRAEPPSLSPKPFRSLGLTADLSGRMFNAGLTIRNDAGLPVPYLAETSTFPGLSTTSTPPGETAFSDYRSDRIPTAENRWRGSNNRGAWPGTAVYNRLLDTFESSLDRNERTAAIVEMARVITEDVVVINLYWKLNAQAVANGVVGPRLTDPNGSAEWNIHEWEFR